MNHPTQFTNVCARQITGITGPGPLSLQCKINADNSFQFRYQNMYFFVSYPNFRHGCKHFMGQGRFTLVEIMMTLGQDVKLTKFFTALRAVVG